MGLHIVRTLVKEMGSEMAVKSQMGKGSKFSFCLKMKELGAPAEEVKEVLLERPDGEVALAGVNILVAEDDEDSRKLMMELFADAECHIRFVCNGEEVIKEMKRKKYDLVLMDLKMPRIDGYEAAEIIRRDIDKNVPILALTAHVVDWVEGKCIDAGMNGYITKPVNANRLTALIKQYV